MDDAIPQAAPRETAAPIAPVFDMAAFMAQLSEHRSALEAQNRASRDALLATLKAAGIETVTARYDAYGDSGNIEEVGLLPELPQRDAAQTTPEGELPFDDGDARLSPETAEQLGDLLWNIVYALHPGFETNDGGFGEIEWDLANDSICIDHNERFTDHRSYLHEGV